MENGVTMDKEFNFIKRKHILIVDDERQLLDLIESILREDGFSSIPTAGSAQEAIVACHTSFPDLAILDVNLPDRDGFSLMKDIRQIKDIPILFLTARDKPEDMFTGLDAGGDDYMTKPFSVSELLARVEALCRRVHRAESEEERDPAKELGTLTSGDFVLDENRRVLLKAGQPIELTQVEFQIMELFFRNPGIALVREKILKGVWGENYFGDVKIVDVNIRRLRMKVEDEPSHPTHIMTVWGYGYRWEE